ncbi:hypothetical protein [Streptomyces californicus]|uniref:hypothetical protein n=1 Tax=Streptomyces californicus TaxID=67351 RepID=UPI0033F16AFC
MPTPERAAQPRPTSSALSMKDLLASCAAATAVSTPPAATAKRTAARDGAGPRDTASAHPQAA